MLKTTKKIYLPVVVEIAPEIHVFVETNIPQLDNAVRDLPKFHCASLSSTHRHRQTLARQPADRVFEVLPRREVCPAVFVFL